MVAVILSCLGHINPVLSVERAVRGSRSGLLVFGRFTQICRKKMFTFYAYADNNIKVVKKPVNRLKGKNIKKCCKNQVMFLRR